MNAYPYGPQLVPISSILENDAKWKEEKKLQLLGFVPESKVPRHAYLS